MDILRYARANGCPWNVLTCAYAAAAGHLEALKWARAEGCGWYVFVIWLVGWLLSQYCDWYSLPHTRA